MNGFGSTPDMKSVSGYGYVYRSPWVLYWLLALAVMLMLIVAELAGTSQSVLSHSKHAVYRLYVPSARKHWLL